MPDSGWINAEALAAYVAMVISAVILVLGWWLFRIKRPRRIICQQISMLSLVEIDERIKPRTTMVLDKGEASEREAEELSQTVIDISNTSRDTIDDIKIKLKFDVPVLDTALDVPSDLEENARTSVSLGSDGLSGEIVFTTPYLKSFKTYKDKVKLTVLTSGRPTALEVGGGGRDWKAYYKSIEDKRRELERRSALVTGFAGLLASVTTLVVLGSADVGQADADLTWTGILVGFLLAGIVGFAMSRMLWAWGLGPIRAFFRPQTVVHKTAKSPFQVFLGSLGSIAILGVFSLAILYLIGILERYLAFLSWARILRALQSDQSLTLLVVGLILIIVAVGLAASEKGNQEQK
jgi:hypothetical protein